MSLSKQQHHGELLPGKDLENFARKMIKLTSSVNFAGNTLIIPSVCVGNVAQLSVDLIVETLKMQKVGLCWHPAMIPIIGPPAYWRDQKDNTTTACELFTVDTAEANKRISVMQIRSPLVASQMHDFFDNLMEFIEKQEFKEVIVLSSCYAHEKHVVDESPFEYSASEGFKSDHQAKLDALNWRKHSAEGFPRMLGGGFASQLFMVLQTKKIPAMTLFKYVSEGDNSPDAREMTTKLNDFLEVLPMKEDGTPRLTVPPSWKLLFGDAAPQSMF
ncbi:proteasome assembly chaperone 2 [Phlebotomus argentipes]|uniref:proteasome assembly chaperone 2 n=1 Tax=Phlebotomus argentipes TaxID=94469 RepID=UPI002892ABBE|nr:proteasome assembly chaperone 2 [Phlebotomus argentipes]